VTGREEDFMAWEKRKGLSSNAEKVEKNPHLSDSALGVEPKGGKEGTGSKIP